MFTPTLVHQWPQAMLQHLTRCLWGLLLAGLTTAILACELHPKTNPIAAPSTEPDNGPNAFPEAPVQPSAPTEASGDPRSHSDDGRDAPLSDTTEEGRPQYRPHAKSGSGVADRSPGHSPREREYQPRPQMRRPGLATQWGERRRSEVHEVHFHRDSEHHPRSLVTFHYDSALGVERVTGQDEDNAYPGVVPVQGGALSVSVIEPDEDPLPQLIYGGKNYIIGERGDRYAIRIQNHSAERFEIVASVDGLDVLNGSDAGFHNRGYLVEPWGTLKIEGFRESQRHIRAFRFGSVASSYAARRGKARNVGVIGVALFAERGYRPRHDWQRHEANPFPKRYAPPPP